MIGRICAVAIASVVVLAGLLVVTCPPSGAGCDENVSIRQVHGKCRSESFKLARRIITSGDGHTYTLKMICPGERVGCNPPSEDVCRPPHRQYWLLRDGEAFRWLCLSPSEASELFDVSPGQVLREFKRLRWPSAELIIQPPDHRTMVNLKTLFSTTLAESRTQTVTLLGQRVTIEATPTSYVWHSDVAGDAWETTDPGQPYQPGDNPEQLNHYVYLDADVTVHPSVDVVYSGRYRVGNGAWQDIPETLTVAGDTQSLEVTQAAPVLNGP